MRQLPLQHCTARLHEEPLGRHAQTPAAHSEVLHSSFVAQVSPLFLPTHRREALVSQMPLQQLEGMVHPAPLGVHDGAVGAHLAPPEPPPRHARPGQQALPPGLQGDPASRHAATHTPPVQAPLQHSLPAMQPAPTDRHAHRRLPSEVGSHLPLQHSAFAAQAPARRQVAQRAKSQIIPQH